MAFVMSAGVALADGPFKLTAGGVETTYATLTDAVTALNAVNASTACVLEITEDATFSESVGIMHDKVTLRSAGDNVFTLKRTNANSTIIVGSSADLSVEPPSNGKYTLTISNITIDGGAVWASSDVTDLTNSGIGAGSAVLFGVGTAYNKYGAITLGAGATVQNVQTGSSNPAGAVYFSNKTHGNAAGSIFTMNAGSKITRCRGAAAAAFLRINSKPMVYIKGGEICHCYSSGNGGGIYITGNSNVNIDISGGAIHHCRANNGGGIYFNIAYPIMSGGEIYANTATVSGGGFYCNSSYTAYAGQYTGGSISGNSAGTSGGGVYLASNGKSLEISGATRMSGNLVGSVANNLYTDNKLTAAKLVLGSLMDDYADVGLMLAINGNVGDTFATATAGLTDADLYHIHLDTNVALHPTVDGTDVKWANGAAPVTATVTTGSGSMDYGSLSSALAVANAEASATLTLHTAVSISSDYEITGNVTLQTDNLNGVSLSSSNNAKFIVADGGKLTMAGADVTIAIPVTVESGATLAIATGASPSFSAPIDLPAGSVLELAGAPAFSSMPVLNDASTLTLTYRTPH